MKTLLKTLKWTFGIVGLSVFSKWIGIEYSTQLTIFLIFAGFFTLTLSLLILISYLERKKQEKKVEEYSRKLKDVNQEVLINLIKGKGSGER